MPSIFGCSSTQYQHDQCQQSKDELDVAAVDFLGFQGQLGQRAFHFSPLLCIKKKVYWNQYYTWAGFKGGFKSDLKMAGFPLFN